MTSEEKAELLKSAMSRKKCVSSTTSVPAQNDGSEIATSTQTPSVVSLTSTKDACEITTQSASVVSLSNTTLSLENVDPGVKVSNRTK